MTMTNEHPLSAHAGDVFPTRVGGAFPGDRAVFRGHDLHQSPLKDLSWVELYGFSVNAKRLSKAQAEMIESIWVMTSYPDARIWNNRIAALAGSTRSTPTVAIAAANAVSEATIYGRRNEHKALAFFWRMRAETQAGEPLAECLARYERECGKLPGYGRPLAMHDERIAPTMARARELGQAEGPHVSLAFEIERCLRGQGRPLRLNLGALVSAFGADFGFSPREFSLFFFPCFLAGMLPCYLEGLEKPAGAVFATPCSGVNYTGVGKRAWT